MINQSMIEEVTRRLVEAYNPVEIYLFGSYAWGSPTPDSDLDILIVVDASDEKSYKRPVRGYRSLRGIDVSKDLIVYTKIEFDKAIQEVNTLCYKIKKDGERIYARA